VALHHRRLFRPARANLWVGVSKVGYSVAEETPIMPPIFALPAAPGFVWRKFS